MCGIIVVIGNNSKEKAEKCIQKISHRGKDNYTIKTYKNISFAFTRLAINDVSDKGNQPFEYNAYIGLFNAEIYNHLEIKNTYNFTQKGKSDTEIILPLYEKEQENIVSILDGFYSGIIYNKKTESLIFLKDYIGKKPLFFAYDNDTRYISSELKALPKIKYFEIIPKGISKLKDKKIIKVKTHSIDKSSNFSDDTLYSIIKNAVHKRTVDIKNEKIAIFLSGGLDSSIIAILASKILHLKHIQYYALLDKEHPDYAYIQIMKKSLNLNSNDFKMINLPSKKELISLIKELVYCTESYNPSIISNGIGSYLLSKEANRDGIKVVLTGDGADEMFMGYYNDDSISDIASLKEKQQNLINDLHFTELRRVDLTSMANTIEIRCPFLDKDIHTMVSTLKYNDFFGNDEKKLNKNILRKAFKEDLPKDIYNRPKVSFDVGSGIQKLMIEICKESGMTEEKYLKNIWNTFFIDTLSEVKENTYFYSYPVFNKVIPNRSHKYTL